MKETKPGAEQTSADANAPTHNALSPFEGADTVLAVLPTSSDAFSFPPKTKCRGLVGSMWVYCSAITHTTADSAHTYSLTDPVTYEAQHINEEREAHIGAIAVKSRVEQRSKKTRLDVYIVVVDSEDGKARAVKPSEITPVVKADAQTQAEGESKASSASAHGSAQTAPLTAAKQLDIVQTARRWAQATHVEKPARREANRLKAQAALEKQRELRSGRTGTGTASAKHEKDKQKGELAFALAQAIDPLAQAVSALQHNQLALAEAMALANPRKGTSSASTLAHTRAHDQTTLTTVPTLSSSVSVAPSSVPTSAVFATPTGSPSLLAAAFAHSQLSQVHLSQQSALLTAFISPEMFHAAAATANSMASLAESAASHPPTPATAAEPYSPEPRPSKRRKTTRKFFGFFVVVGGGCRGLFRVSAGCSM